jgi:endonuclease/exonuclease/phosphatase family metal-dependent hydrolase
MPGMNVAWLISVLPALLLAMSAAGQEAANKPPVRLRVLTYNIHHAEGTDRKLDPERIARVIKDANPDLVALQEVDDRTGRTESVDQAKKLGELTGMHAFFAKAMDYRGGGYGCAILSKRKPDAGRSHALPAEEGHEPRVLAEARVKLTDAGPTVVFYSTHLDHTRDPKSRQKQIAGIRKVTAEEKEPLAILAGDLNAQPGSKEIETLLKDWKDATANPALKTHPAEAPRIKIDYVLYRANDRVKVIEAQVLEEKVASDHAPVLVVFEVAQEKVGQ